MRLIVVSNRLPFTLIAKENQFELRPSIGGLVTGIKAYLKHFAEISPDNHSLWVGWPGLTIKDHEKNIVVEKLQQKNCYPVMVHGTIMEKFYAGFCNKTLWPLFHYFSWLSTYDDEQWNIYKNVNQTFCDVLAEIIQPNDVIWIQDYHLMVLPKLLREKFPDLAIGFFLHIPFPSFEVLQFLPKNCRNELLEGMINADLVGFHTHEYTQHFVKSVLRMLGYEQNMGFITNYERFVKIDTYPIGIDFTALQNLQKKPLVRKLKTEIKNQIKKSKAILSIDRLDYTKGIANRLYAFEKFLLNNPDWHKRVVLLLIVAPSREGVTHYQTMKKQIDELVGYINGKFGSIDWTPILYQYQAISFDQLAALYASTDVALITPLRDGMNLIVKEYLTSRINKKGVLILSETAGAAKELLDAIIVNPNCIDEISAAIKQALEMDTAEQIRRLTIMQSRLQRYDITRWGNDFIADLLDTKQQQENFSAKFIQPTKLTDIVTHFNQAKRRLLLLDYDGTLVPFKVNPEMAYPDETLLQLLDTLAKDEKNRVVIVSGRNKNTLQKWLGQLNIGLVAEHGMWVRQQQEWHLSTPVSNHWKAQLMPVFEDFMDKLPGTFIEDKEFAIAWHYRGADPDKGSQLAKELADHLVSMTANTELQISFSKKVIEAKLASIGKNLAVTTFAKKNAYDFILAIGDDTTDEDMFRALPKDAYSLKVGIDASYAKFNIRTPADVIHLLTQFCTTEMIAS